MTGESREKPRLWEESGSAPRETPGTRPFHGAELSAPLGLLLPPSPSSFHRSSSLSIFRRSSTCHCSRTVLIVLLEKLSSPQPPGSRRKMSNASPAVSKDKPAGQKKKTPLGVHLVAGGTAGLAEALVCRKCRSPARSLARLWRLARPKSWPSSRFLALS